MRARKTREELKKLLGIVPYVIPDSHPSGYTLMEKVLLAMHHKSRVDAGEWSPPFVKDGEVIFYSSSFLVSVDAGMVPVEEFCAESVRGIRRPRAKTKKFAKGMFFTRRFQEYSRPLGRYEEIPAMKKQVELEETRKDEIKSFLWMIEDIGLSDIALSLGHLGDLKKLSLVDLRAQEKGTYIKVGAYTSSGEILPFYGEVDSTDTIAEGAYIGVIELLAAVRALLLLWEERDRDHLISVEEGAEDASASSIVIGVPRMVHTECGEFAVVTLKGVGEDEEFSRLKAIIPLKRNEFLDKEKELAAYVNEDGELVVAEELKSVSIFLQEVGKSHNKKSGIK